MAANTVHADIAASMRRNYNLKVVGIPKDNHAELLEA